MNAENVERLCSLLLASGPSGYEESVISLFERFIHPFVDEVFTDNMGNCIAHKRGVGKKILLTAHADEIGLIITRIDEKGFLYFKEIGGIDTSILQGKKVMITGEKGVVMGVIGKKPIHLQNKSENIKSVKSESLWIDIAVDSKKEAEGMVQLGSIATILSEPLKMSNSLFASKSLDNRIGLLCLIAVAQNLKKLNSNYDIYYVATVQEELGARGAQVVAEHIRPDIGIVVDVTHASDYPTMMENDVEEIRLGGGVVISLGPNMDKDITKKLIKTADLYEIKHQIEIISLPTGTDARMIQVSGCGVRTGLISIPCRYMHTPNEMVSLKDSDSAINLLTFFLQNRDC